MPEAQSGKNQVLFIRGGGGEEAYAEDGKLAASLQAQLGAAYNVCYPRMPDDDAPTSAWLKEIDTELDAIEGKVILVGHSVGGAVLLQYLAENRGKHQLAGLFLMAAPFWDGDKGWQYEGFRLPADFAASFPQAIVREGVSDGHQFDNDLDIQNL